MKLRTVALSLIALAMLVLGAAARLPVNKAEAYPGADNIYLVSQACNPDGTVRISLGWTTYSLGAQWMDLSHSNNGWVFGTFVGAGPFQPWENSFVPWYGIGAGRATYVRINTFDGTIWHPSSTIQFFTRNDCVVSADGDQDGIANAQDACPSSFGVSWNNGCPAIPPSGGTDPVSMWAPGQAPPAAQCTPAGSGCVWPTKGNGTAYANGEVITVCYWVPAATNVYIDTVRPDGSTIATLLLGPAVAPLGNCFNAGVVGVPPAGQRTFRLFSGPNMVQLTQLDTATWTGQ